MTRYRRGPTTVQGLTSVWVVDEHGCLLHTEPVCLVNEQYFPWFLKWLEGSPVQVRFPELLRHEFSTKKVEVPDVGEDTFGTQDRDAHEGRPGQGGLHPSGGSVAR